MAKIKRTVKKEVLLPVIPDQRIPKTVEIPLTLLRHLVRLTGNRQAKSFLRIATGKTYVTNQPGENVVEPEVAKVEKKERAKLQQKEATKPTPEAKIIKRAEVAKAKAIDKNFNKK